MFMLVRRWQVHVGEEVVGPCRWGGCMLKSVRRLHAHVGEEAACSCW